MQDETSTQPSPTFNLTSVLFGIASGIIATVIYAKYKQRDFDRLIGKSRGLANSASDYVDHAVDDAQSFRSDIAESAQEGIRSASRTSKEAMEAVRGAVLG